MNGGESKPKHAFAFVFVFAGLETCRHAVVSLHFGRCCSEDNNSSSLHPQHANPNPNASQEHVLFLLILFTVVDCKSGKIKKKSKWLLVSSCLLSPLFKLQGFLESTGRDSGVEQPQA